MAYLGRTPSQAVRSRYYFTASGGETSLSGNDSSGNTLTFTDGNYVDVNLNGVTLVAGSDYNTTTANTIGGLAALTASDVVEIVVYDTFSVFGGNVLGDFTVSNGTTTVAALTATGAISGTSADFDGGVTIDNITIDGTEIDLSSGDLTIDVAGDIILDADGGDVNFKDGGVLYGFMAKSNDNLLLGNGIQDGDVLIRGNDGGSNITALTLDMSDAGTAIFNNNVGISNSSPSSQTAGAQNLVVGTSGATGITIASSNNNNGSIFFADGTSGNEGYRGYLQYAHTNDALVVGTSATERLRIDGSGNVGIGNSSMSSYYSDRFVLGVGDEDGMTIAGSSTHQNYIMFADGTSGDARYKGYIAYDHNVDTMKLATNGATRLQIDSAGRAGLGVTPAAVADSTGVASLQAGGTFLIHYDIDGSGTTSLSNNLYFNGTANKALFYGSTSQYYQNGGAHIWRSSGVTGAGSTATLTERMRIEGSAGHVYIGHTSGLNFGGGTTAGITFDPNGALVASRSGDSPLYLQRSSSDGNIASFYKDTAFVGSISVTSSATAFNTSSDYRLKENVDYTWDATTRLKQLKPARFNFIAEADTTVDGFLAHEVSSIVPEAITGTKDAVDADGNPEYQGIDQSKLVPLLVKTILELEARITALEGN